MMKKLICAILPFYVKCNNFLLAADDGLSLGNAKYGDFEFHSWQTIGNDRLVVGGRNELLIYETNEEKVLLEKETIQLKPDNLTINNCQRSGNTVEECDNILLAIGTNNQDHIWVCGTHAARPILFKFNLDQTVPIRQSGQTCPSNFEASTFIVTEGDEINKKSGSYNLFTITDDDHQPHIIKSNSETMEIQLRTPEDELARVWLNNPKFITTVDRGDRLLMFFREEIPSQNPEFKSEWINRVASICKNDIGGDMETILERVFMSFAKIQISCSNSKSTKFSFDRLVSVVETDDGFFGVFIGSNSRGEYESGICEFDFDEIEEAFSGSKFLAENKIEDWNQFKNENGQTYQHPYNCNGPHDYPPWLQYWRVRSPLLAGRLEKSPFLSFEGESTSATAYKRSPSQTQLYIGFSDGKTVRFDLDNGRAVDRTVRPAPTEYNCGKVKSLKMHNNHVLIAWEKCLIEEIDWNYKRSTMTQIKDASQMDSLEQSIASLTKTITIIENHYKLKINEMENKVKDLQSALNFLTSKMETEDQRTWDQITTDFDALRVKIENSERNIQTKFENVENYGSKFETVQNEIRKNMYRSELAEKRISQNENSIRQLDSKVEEACNRENSAQTSYYDDPISSKAKRGYVMSLDEPIQNRVDRIEKLIQTVDRKVEEKAKTQERQLAQHRGGLMTTVQRIMGQTNDMAKAKQATCHSWITHIKEKVDVLDQEVTQLRHKKRRKRKTRSGKKKHQIKSKSIRVQATRGDIRRKSPVKSPHPVVISPDVIVPNAA